jgi:hypothetical protein
MASSGQHSMQRTQLVPFTARHALEISALMVQGLIVAAGDG